MSGSSSSNLLVGCFEYRYVKVLWASLVLRTNKYEIHAYGPLTDVLYGLLHLALENNVFMHENTYYRQTRGLAMGSRLSGTLVILAMDRFATEQKFVYQEIK